MRLICSVNILSLSGSVSINMSLNEDAEHLHLFPLGQDCWRMSVTILKNPFALWTFNTVETGRACGML